MGRHCEAKTRCLILFLLVLMCLTVPWGATARGYLETPSPRPPSASLLQTVFPQPFEGKCLPKLPHKDTVWVLSLKGGGIRGIMAAQFLKELVEVTGVEVSGLFDVIAGTSTGGIIALALSVYNAEKTGPEFTAADIVQLYLKQGPQIFKRTLSQKIRSLGGLLGPKYDSGNLLKVGATYGLDKKLSEAIKPVFITSQNLSRNSLPNFISHPVDGKKFKDYWMSDVALATSAAPTYFKPVRFSPIGEIVEDTYIDGGLAAIDPSIDALGYAKKLYPTAKKFFVISVGTGYQFKTTPYKNAKKKGLLSWAPDAIALAMEGHAQQTQKFMKNVLGPENYFLFDAPLVSASPKMDKATKKNMHNLLRDGEAMYMSPSGDYKQSFMDVAERLRAHALNSKPLTQSEISA